MRFLYIILNECWDLWDREDYIRGIDGGGRLVGWGGVSYVGLMERKVGGMK